MHTSGRVQTGYMQHHPLFGEYTLERNEMKRLRKSAIPPVSLVVVSMCRLWRGMPAVPLSRAPPSRTRTVFRGDSELGLRPALGAEGQLSGLFYLNIP